MDIYKWTTPHVDLIAPGIYAGDSRGHDSACAAYARDGNPLFEPESSPGGPNGRQLLLPHRGATLVLRFWGTGKLHTIVEEQHAGPQRLDLEGYLGLVEFGAGPPSLVRPKDWCHPSQDGHAATAGAW